MMSPRPGLMPGTDPRSSLGSAASVSTSSLEHRRGDDEALDAEIDPAVDVLGSGCQVAHRAADPDEARARGPSHFSPGEGLLHVCAHPGELLALDRAGAREELLGTRTAPSGNETVGPLRRSRTSVSCMLPPPMSSTTPSSRVVVLTAAT